MTPRLDPVEIAALEADLRISRSRRRRATRRSSARRRLALRAIVVVVGLAIAGAAFVDVARSSTPAKLDARTERAARFVGWYSFYRLPACGHPEIRVADHVRPHGGAGAFLRMRIKRSACRITFDRDWLAAQTPVDVCVAFAHASGHLIGYDHDDGLEGVDIMARLPPMDYLPCTFALDHVQPGAVR